MKVTGPKQLFSQSSPFRDLINECSAYGLRIQRIDNENAMIDGISVDQFDENGGFTLLQQLVASGGEVFNYPAFVESTKDPSTTTHHLDAETEQPVTYKDFWGSRNHWYKFGDNWYAETSPRGRAMTGKELIELNELDGFTVISKSDYLTAMDSHNTNV